MVLNLLVRKVLGLLNGSADPTLPTEGSTIPAGELAIDTLRALWVRDYQQQPAQSWTPITPSDSTAFTAANPVITFRALRFDSTGTVKFDTPTATGITRNVVAGDVWSASSNAILKIYASGTSVSAIDGLG